MAYCVNCGKKLPDDAKFCDQCGAEIIRDDPPESAEEEEFTYVPPWADTGSDAGTDAGEDADDVDSLSSKLEAELYQMPLENLYDVSSVAEKEEENDDWLEETEKPSISADADDEDEKVVDRHPVLFVVLLAAILVVCGLIAWQLYNMYLINRPPEQSKVTIVTTDSDENG